MRRESVYTCTYDDGANELVGHVRAWDGREAAELFAHEVEIDSGGPEIRVADVRVRSSSGRGAEPRSVAS